ncbi:MAG: formylglycine-generating enzyme family protein [Limisphaerales bacterium]
MKTRFQKLVRFLCLLCLALWAAAPRTSAQSPPGLGLNLYPGVSIAGVVGTVCAIQATANAAQTNGWTCLALVQLPATNYLWVDTSATVATGQRFYRAVVTATNLASILPGAFTMGSPRSEALRGSDETQHVVTISRGFWMGEYLVTQADYQAVAGSNPSTFQGETTLPVETVSWDDATNYCALRTEQERAAGLIPANYVYRLPTESEWEYACRAGTTTAFDLGNDLDSGQANFEGQYEYDAALGEIDDASGIYLQKTTPVGSYAPNGWGLYDMIGNVFEWCQDWYGPYPTGPATDPQGVDSGPYRVIRGGSWYHNGQYCRSALRRYYPPGGASSFSSFIGFRVVLAQGQP